MKESSFMKRINTKKSAVISLIVLLCFGIGYYVLAISPHQIAVQSFNEVIAKIENDGYTYPHYDKKNNGVKYVISTMDIKRDCLRLGVPFEDVYPLQTTLF